MKLVTTTVTLTPSVQRLTVSTKESATRRQLVSWTPSGVVTALK